jgi:hypothetical protein
MQIRRLLIVSLFVLALAAPGIAQEGAPAQLAAHSHTSGATITLTTFPNQSVYVTGIDITNCQGTAVTAAAPTFITTTGLNGSPQYMVGSGPAAAGTCTPTASVSFARPIKSQTPGTNVTFVLPAFVTNQTVSVNVYYYIAP